MGNYVRPLKPFSRRRVFTAMPHILAALKRLPIVIAPCCCRTRLCRRRRQRHVSGSFHVTRPTAVCRTTDRHDPRAEGYDGHRHGRPTADQQNAIKNGKMTGDKLTFDTTTPDGAAVSFTLTLANGHLKGDAAASPRAGR